MTLPMTIYSRGNPDLTLSGGGPSTLFGMAQEILTRAESCLAQLGLAIPARRIVYPSPIPADCEQLAVLFSGWVPQPQWNGLANCSEFRWCGNFAVGLTRPTPAKQGARTAPSAAAMDEAAVIASADAEALILLAGSFDELAELTIITEAPDGGYQTTVLNMQLPAYGAM